MSDNTNPIEPQASALSAPPPVATAAPTPGLWGRLTRTQRWCAVVSGSVVTLVGGIAGYTKLTTKPPAPTPEPKTVVSKPVESEPEPSTRLFDDPTTLPPVPKPSTPTRRNDEVDLRLPEVPALPTVRSGTPTLELPVTPPTERPKVRDDFTAPKLPEIPDIAPPKELPADLTNKKEKGDKTSPLIIRTGAEETTPPPKKDMTDPLKLDLPAIPAPPAKIDLPPLMPPTPPMGMGMTDPLKIVTPPTPPMDMGTKKDDLPLLPPPPMDMGKKKDDLPTITPPTPPTPPMPMGMKKDDLPLIVPPTPPTPMKMDDLPPLPPLGMNMGMGTPPMKKDDHLPPIGIPEPMKKDDPAPIGVKNPPLMIDPPVKVGGMNDPITVTPRKDMVPTPVKDSYEEDWHTPKASDTFASISQEYYKTKDYGPALEAYNKSYKQGTDRIIRVPPPWVLKEKFPTLVNDLGDVKLPERTEPRPETKPGLKFDPVEVPTIGTRPAPPPAVAPANSRNDEYRVQNPSGESIREIARKTFGSADQWKRLWELNPQLDPTEPIPAGTVLRLSK